MKDPFKILGVDSNSSDEEIKKAVNKLRYKWHPDKQVAPEAKKQAEEKIKEINNAYDQIKNAEARQKYQQQQTFGHGFDGGFDFNGGGFNFDFSNFFNGGGNNNVIDVYLTITEAMQGINKTISYNTNCNYCICGSCGGAGAKGFFVLSKCSSCNGSGRKNFCNQCHGSGVKNESVTVKLPPYLSINGVFSIPNSNINIRIKIKSTPNINLLPNGDIILTLKVNLSDKNKNISYKDGVFDINVPFNISDSKERKIFKGKGYKKNHSDLIVEFDINLNQ